MNLGLFTGILHWNWLQGLYVLDEELKEKVKFREHSHEHFGGKLKLNVVLNLCDAMMRAGTRIARPRWCSDASHSTAGEQDMDSKPRISLP